MLETYGTRFAIVLINFHKKIIVKPNLPLSLGMLGDTLYTKAEGTWTLNFKKENFEYPLKVQEAVNLYLYFAM